jgi:hypothetical protein
MSARLAQGWGNCLLGEARALPHAGRRQCTHQLQMNLQEANLAFVRFVARIQDRVTYLAVPSVPSEERN